MNNYSTDCFLNGVHYRKTSFTSSAIMVWPNTQKKGKRGGGGGRVWNSALSSAAVAERRDRSCESNCMLLSVSVGTTHFWPAEAVRCLIKALPRKKKERTDYWGSYKGLRMAMVYDPRNGGEKTNQDREKGRTSSTHCAEPANIQGGEWILNGSFVCN